MAFLDWLRRREPTPTAVDTWLVAAEDGFIIVTRENGAEFARAMLGDARSVRVVPLTRGNQHSTTSGWQIALWQPQGDVLVGSPLPNWQSARVLAQRICKATQLPMDEMTEKLFSQVGRLKL